MTNRVVASLLSAIGLGGLLATAAAASVDTSPKPGGVYHLKPGIFVEQGTVRGRAQCGDPPLRWARDQHRPHPSLSREGRVTPR